MGATHGRDPRKPPRQAPPDLPTLANASPRVAPTNNRDIRRLVIPPYGQCA